MNIEAMPTRTEFKFDCPKCSQHILVATDSVGLGISCPSCQTSITVPSPPSGETSAKPAPPRQSTKTTIRIELPSEPNRDAAGPNGHMVALGVATAAVPPRLTGNEPWPELVERLERGAMAEPALLATAVFRELTNVRQRLDEVERQLAGQHPRTSAHGADTQLATGVGN